MVPGWQRKLKVCWTSKTRFWHSHRNLGSSWSRCGNGGSFYEGMSWIWGELKFEGSMKDSMNFRNDWPERKRSEWEVVKQSESYRCATWTQDNDVDTISRWKSTWTGWNHLNWHDTRSGTVVSWCSTSLSTSSLDGMVAHGWYHRRVSQKAFCTCTSLSMFTATWVFSWLVVFLRSFPNTILSCIRS